MSEPKRPLKVFLCHASTDKPKVRDLYRYLKRRGIQPWFDEEHLVGGQDWQVEIPKALATSDAIIICLTKNSVDKEGYIQKEIKFALDKALEMPEGRIFLIPVKFEECEVPFSLSRYQWVDLTIESGYAKMMKALKFRASQLERSTVEVSKNDIEEENLARDKKERETTERAERERKEKELREKQAREAREKAKRETEKKEEKPVTVKPKTGSQITYWFGGFIVLVLGIIFLSSLNNLPSTPQSTPENTQTQEIDTPQNTVEQSMAATLQSTATSAHTLLPTDAFTPTPELGIGSTIISEKDGMVMVYVPEGEFTMGTDSGYSYEGPAHQVFLDSFWIDRTEVTHDQYAKCVQEGECYGDLYNVDFLNYPVRNVDWSDAENYCKWADRRLPTEAEWEKAARGTDARIYPWGDNDPACQYANIPACSNNDYMPVGSFLDGMSPYGAYDLIGNAWEWVADWYSESYYIISPDKNPTGPTGGKHRVLRGGSYNQLVESTSRNWFNPEQSVFYNSFLSEDWISNYPTIRCAMDATP